MEKLIDIFKGLGSSKIAMLAGFGFATLSFLLYFANMTNTPTMGLLYDHLEPLEAARIVDKLQKTGVMVETKGDGTQILVPDDKIPEIRMKLALDGTITSGSMGYELFDRSDVLGTSTAVLNINHVRALEGELSKSIKTIGEVQSARVHLVLPKKELFSKEKTPPSASVILKMKGSQRLSSNQIQAVQALISSAVANLTNDRISIVDDKGTLLARGKDNASNADGFASQIAAREEFEEKISRQVEMLLERSLGADKVRVEVSAELDFDRVTMQSVEFNPDGQVARNVNTAEEGNKIDESTNNGDAASIQNAIPNQQTQTNQGNKSNSANNKSEENTSYEISNKTTTTVKEAGAIKRLSVAVLVDGIYQLDQNGNRVYAPRTPEELKQLTELVQTAVGYREDRGDTVKVVNLKFAVPEIEKLPEISIVQSILNVLDLKRVIEILLVGIFALIIILNFFRPMIKKLLQLEPVRIYDAKGREIIQGNNGEYYATMPVVSGANADTTSPQYTGSSVANPTVQKIIDEIEETDADLNLEHIEGLVKSSSVKRMSTLIKSHPDETIALIRSWLYEEHNL